MNQGGHNMGNKRGQIIWKYVNYIADDVVNKFGGSYQTKESLGKSWRQQMEYNINVENAVIQDTKVWLRLLDNRDQGNLNLMYGVCYDISEHLSKYMVKKSSDLTVEKVTNELLNTLFFNSPHFVSIFKKAYRRPLSNDPKWCERNRGVIAMYNAIQQRQRETTMIQPKIK